jgi:hypothetical protein
MTNKVERYFSPDRKDKNAIGHDATRETWPPGLRYAFPPPPLITMTMVNLIKQKGDLILITPYWPDQPWYAEALQLSREPPRRFAPKETLLWDAIQNKPIPSIMRKVRLLAWRLTYNPVSGEGWTKLLQELPQGDGQLKQRKHTTAPTGAGSTSAGYLEYQTIQWM